MFNIYPIHSTSDVITNSSTELFICNTEKTKEQIKDMFDILSSVVGDAGVGTIEIKDGPKALLEVLHELEYYVEGYTMTEIIGRFIPYDENLRPPQLDVKDLDYSIKDPIERWEKHKQDRAEAWIVVDKWFEDNDEELSKYIKKFVVITGASDNSIPYDLFSIIERRLNGTGLHLG